MAFAPVYPHPPLSATEPPSEQAPHAGPSQRRHRLALSVLIAAGGLLGALLLALAWLEWRGWTPLKGPVESYLSRKLNHEVRFIGGFEMHLWGGPRVRVDALRVGQPAWLVEPGAQEPMISADRFALQVPYGTLLKAATGRPLDSWTVASIDLAGLQARLLRDQQGRANWSLEASGLAPVTPSASKPATIPVVDRLVVSDGRVVIEDKALALSVDATVSTTEGALSKPGQSPGQGLVVQGKGRYKRYPFEVHAEAAGALPLLVNPDLAPPVPITIKAEAGPSRVNFEGVTRDLLSLGSLEGQLDLRGPSLAAIGDVVGVTLPTTARFALTGTLRKRADLWGIQVADLRIGDSRLKGEFTFDRAAQPPLLKGELSGSRLALADLAPAFGAPADGAPANPKPPAGLVLPQREFDVPSLRAMDAAVKVRLQSVTLGSLFAQPLQPLEADLDLHNGVLTISNLLARTAGGNLAGSVKLDSAKSKLLWDTHFNWSGIRLETWLKRADKPGTTDDGKDKTPYVSGELAGKANLRGVGNSTASLLGSLEGDSMVWVREGQVSRLLVEAASLHVAEALGLLLTGDKMQTMQCAVARVDARQGVLTPQAAVVDTPSATILATGSVSLAKEELDLMLTSRPKSLSPLSLRTPVDVKGSFSDPKIGLHANPLSFKVLSAAALATVAPLAAIVPLIDKGNKDDGSQACAQALQTLRKDAK